MLRRWVAGVKEMRQVFSSLEAAGFPRERQEVRRRAQHAQQLTRGVRAHLHAPPCARQRSLRHHPAPAVRCGLTPDACVALGVAAALGLAAEAGAGGAVQGGAGRDQQDAARGARRAREQCRRFYACCCSSASSMVVGGGNLRRGMHACMHSHMQSGVCCCTQMRVSLVVRDHRLVYDPPLEELRARHISGHLSGFLGLPGRMKGVSSLSERPGFFAGVANAQQAAIARVSGDSGSRAAARLSCACIACSVGCSWLLLCCYGSTSCIAHRTRAFAPTNTQCARAANLGWWRACMQVHESCEVLFAALADEAAKYADWTALGQAAGSGVEAYVEAQLCCGGAGGGSGGGRGVAVTAGGGGSGGGLAAWELELRSLKAAARAADKLPAEVRTCVAAPACMRLPPAYMRLPPARMPRICSSCGLLHLLPSCSVSARSGAPGVLPRQPGRSQGLCARHDCPRARRTGQQPAQEGVRATLRACTAGAGCMHASSPAAVHAARAPRRRWPSARRLKSFPTRSTHCSRPTRPALKMCGARRRRRTPWSAAWATCRR